MSNGNGDVAITPKPIAQLGIGLDPCFTKAESAPGKRWTLFSTCVCRFIHHRSVSSRSKSCVIFMRNVGMSCAEKRNSKSALT